MTRIACLLVLLPLVALGCSVDDPAKSRLKPGQTVVVPRNDRGPGVMTATIQGPNGERFPEDNPASKVAYLETGDRAVVVSDEAPDEGAGYRGRWVVIRITSQDRPIPGYDLAGVECRVPRDTVRPIDKEAAP